MEKVKVNVSTSYINEPRQDIKDFSSLVALIDADYLKYLVASSVYKKLQEGFKHSMFMVHETIDSYLDREVFGNYKAKHYVFCFSAPSKNIFRNHIAQEKEYKGNRKNVEDKNFYEEKYDDMGEVYRYINARYQAILFDDLEADDLLSFLQVEQKTFIHSIDKDLKQVPGFHFNLKIRVLQYTTEEEGFNLLIKQCLTGDSTDGIPGLKGCGPKRVDAIAENKSGMPLFLSAINEFVEKKGLTHGIDTFVEMWSLVSMKIDRGEYFKQKYADAFNVINQLTKDDESASFN